MPNDKLKIVGLLALAALALYMMMQWLKRTKSGDETPPQPVKDDEVEAPPPMKDDSRKRPGDEVEAPPPTSRPKNQPYPPVVKPHKEEKKPVSYPTSEYVPPRVVPMEKPPRVVPMEMPPRVVPMEKPQPVVPMEKPQPVVPMEKPPRVVPMEKPPRVVPMEKPQPVVPMEKPQPVVPMEKPVAPPPEVPMEKPREVEAPPPDVEAPPHEVPMEKPREVEAPPPDVEAPPHEVPMEKPVAPPKPEVPMEKPVAPPKPDVEAPPHEVPMEKPVAPPKPDVPEKLPIDMEKLVLPATRPEINSAENVVKDDDYINRYIADAEFLGLYINPEISTYPSTATKFRLLVKGGVPENPYNVDQMDEKYDIVAVNNTELLGTLGNLGTHAKHIINETDTFQVQTNVYTKRENSVFGHATAISLRANSVIGNISTSNIPHRGGGSNNVNIQVCDIKGRDEQLMVCHINGVGMSRADNIQTVIDALGLTGRGRQTYTNLHYIIIAGMPLNRIEMLDLVYYTLNDIYPYVVYAPTIDMFRDRRDVYEHIITSLPYERLKYNPPTINEDGMLNNGSLSCTLNLPDAGYEAVGDMEE